MATKPATTAAPRAHAKHDGTTANEHLAAIAEAAARVDASAPSISALGKHLADVERAYSENDGAWDCNPGRSAALAILDARRDALRDLIVTLPARTMPDAAVQIEAATQIAQSLSATECDAKVTEHMAEQIERVLLGILPIVSAAAGLDLEAMFWTDIDSLRVHRFAGVGVQS